MEDFTIISYPGSSDSSLLSLADTRSKYMLPFGGRYRVVDFTVRNSAAAGARHTIIYSNCEDDLEHYVEMYGPFKNEKFPAIRVVSQKFSDVKFCYNLILDANTSWYVIYNGDNPSLIDFAGILARYKKSRAGAMLFKMRFGDRDSMAHTILVTNQKNLLAVINQAIDEGRHAPNLFEMIINSMINTGIKKASADVVYWPIKNIPDYYQFNYDIMTDRAMAGRVFGDAMLKSHIRAEGYAKIGRHAKVTKSFISDSCAIDGTVDNSIIFPGVEIGAKAVIRDSIVLPFNRIGGSSYITRSIIDEHSVPEPAGGVTQGEAPYTIGPRCRVGSSDEQLKNNDFPRAIFRSITLIGKDCDIPEGSHIGGACYVASGRGAEFFAKTKYLYNGLSLVK